MRIYRPRKIVLLAGLQRISGEAGVENGLVSLAGEEARTKEQAALTHLYTYIHIYTHIYTLPCVKQGANWQLLYNTGARPGTL